MRALWFCLLLLSPAIANAQNAVKVSCRFLCMDGTTPPEKLMILADKDAEISCEIPEDRLSPAMVCDVKGNTIRFLSPKDRKPAATATIPANTKSAILVFIDGAKTPDALPWRVYVIEGGIL